MIRVWPLVTRSRVSEDVDPNVLNCRPYDPRPRPWYISSSTGNKDVVILVDSSISMKISNDNGDTAIDLVRNALKQLLETFSLGDFINVVGFSDTASAFYEEQPLLSMRNDSGVEILKERINNTAAIGEVNHTAGFEKAFDLFEDALTKENEFGYNQYSSNCTQILIVFTDGHTNEEEDAMDIIDYVTKRQRQMNNKDGVSIFTYTVGYDADDFLTRVLACKNRGAWMHIDINEDDILTRMNSYFTYIADGKDNQKPVWTLPYFDDYGLGYLVTCSVSFYARPSQDIRYLTFM